MTVALGREYRKGYNSDLAHINCMPMSKYRAKGSSTTVDRDILRRAVGCTNEVITENRKSKKQQSPSNVMWGMRPDDSSSSSEDTDDRRKHDAEIERRKQEDEEAERIRKAIVEERLLKDKKMTTNTNHCSTKALADTPTLPPPKTESFFNFHLDGAPQNPFASYFETFPETVDIIPPNPFTLFTAAFTSVIELANTFAPLDLPDNTNEKSPAFVITSCDGAGSDEGCFSCRPCGDAGDLTKSKQEIKDEKELEKAIKEGMRKATMAQADPEVNDTKLEEIEKKKIKQRNTSSRLGSKKMPMKIPPPPPRKQAVDRNVLAASNNDTEQNRNNKAAFPLHHVITLPNRSELVELELSVSELTMRSHTAQLVSPRNSGNAAGKSAPEKRMAYYAVGRHHPRDDKNKSDGRNRRCYFTGRVVRSGKLFYAGSVQQGLRTLVVFCLPSAIGLPESLEESKSNTGATKTINDEAGVSEANSPTTTRSARQAMMKRTGNGNEINGPMNLNNTDTRLSDRVDHHDESSLKYNRQATKSLPNPSSEFLSLIKSKYPEQYATLPIQVRSPHCWKIFFKFCFFSGLPISEGEMHYRLKPNYSSHHEEVILSHDVMEVVNGEQSADMLRLPNTKTFAYLKRNYAQQSAKLDESIVFDRKYWEVVLPEF